MGSEEKSRIYQEAITRAIETFFPLKTTKRRNTDPPWINATIKRMIQWRKRIYKEQGGRTRLKKRIQKLIDTRCKLYQELQKAALMSEDGLRNFFKNTKNYLSKQRPVPFGVMNLFPGRSEVDVSELLAAHFNEISQEFSPLVPADVPNTYNKDLPELLVHQVATRLP